MVDKTNKELNDLAKIFSKLGKELKKNTTASDKVLDISSEQLKVLKQLTSGDIKKPVDEFFGIGFFDPKKGYQKILEEDDKKRKEFLEEQMEKEEELAKLKQENSNEELDSMLKRAKIKEKTNEETSKRAEKDFKDVWTEYDKDEEKRAKKAKTLGYFKEAKGEFLKTWDFIKFLPVIGTIVSTAESLFEVFKNLVFQPLKGFVKILMGIGSFVFGGRKTKTAKEAERMEESESESEKQSDNMQSTLDEISKNTEKEKKMKKAGGIMGFLGKLFPKNLFGGLLGGIGAGAMTGIGGTLLRMVGGAMIFGGIAMFINDFLKGFKEGGISGGLSQMFLGKLDGTIMSSLKNAGKYALLGAGIGSVVPVVGTVAGALIGGAVGFLLNFVGSMFKDKDSAASKLLAWSTEKINSAWSYTKEKASEFIDWVGEILPKMFEGLKNIFSSMIDRVKYIAKKLNPFGDSEKPTTQPKKSGGFLSSVKSFFTGKKDIPNATSQSEMKTVEIQTNQKEKTSQILEKTIQQNTFFKSATEHLKNIEDFMKNDMIGSIKNIMSESMNALYRGMMQMNYQQGAFSAYQNGGISGVEGYTQEYRQFAQDFMKLSKNKDFVQQSSEANNIVSNSGNTIVNNTTTGINDFKLINLEN